MMNGAARMVDQVLRRWSSLSALDQWALLLATVAAATCLRNLRYVDDGPLGGPDWPEILPHLRAVDAREALGWWTGDWVQHNGFYRPLTSHSLLLDYELTGEHHPAWWRVHNVLLMAVVSCLLAVFVRLVTGSAVSALIAGLCATERSVGAWIVGYVSPRTDVLCALLSLAALIAALHWVRTGRRCHLGVALLMAALAPLCKETGVLLAFTMPLVLWSVRAPLRRAAALSGAVIGVLAAYWLIRSVALDVSPFDIVRSGHPFPAVSKLTAFVEVVLPVYRDRLYYPQLELPSLLSLAPWLTMLGSVVSLAQWPLAGLFRPRLLVLGVLWEAITVAPALNYLRIARHYEYIPHLGGALLYGCAAGYACQWIGRRLAARREAQ